MATTSPSLQSSVEFIKQGIRTLRNDKIEGRARETDLSIRYAEAVEVIKSLEEQVNAQMQREELREDEIAMVIEEMQRAKSNEGSMHDKVLVLEKEIELQREKLTGMKDKEDALQATITELRNQLQSLESERRDYEALNKNFQDRLQLKDHELISYVRDRKKTSSRLQAYVDEVTEKWQSALSCCEKITDQLRMEIERKKLAQGEIAKYREQLAHFKAERKTYQEVSKQLESTTQALTAKEDKIENLEIACSDMQDAFKALQIKYNMAMEELEKSKAALASLQNDQEDGFAVAEQLKLLLVEARKSRDEHELRAQELADEVTKYKSQARDTEGKLKAKTEEMAREKELLHYKVSKLESDNEILRAEMIKKDREIGHFKQESLAKELQTADYERAELQKEALLRLRNSAEANLLEENQKLQGKITLLQVYRNLDEGKTGGRNNHGDEFDSRLDRNITSICLPKFKAWQSGYPYYNSE